MAMNEACQLWIEQEIDSGLERGDTPYAIGQLIAKEVEKLFEVKIPPETVRSRARRQKKKEEGERSNDQFPKKARTQTKPEMRTVLNEAVKAIEENAVSDDDAKRVVDAVAQKVESEVIHPRVISKAVKADREYHKKRKREVIKAVPSQVELLNRKLADCSEQLELLAQGDIKITLTDQKYLASIKAKSLSIMWSYHDLGVDLVAVYRFIVGRKEIGDGKFSDTDIQPENIITVEGKVVT